METRTVTTAPALPSPFVAGLLTPWARPWLAMGTACVLAGGFVAAGTAAAPTENGAWAAAYLVLVAGVAQICLTLGTAVYTGATYTETSWQARAQHGVLAAWNVGNACVIVGTLVDVVALVDVGGGVLALTLAAAAYGTRGATPSAALWAYRIVVAVLLVSIPAGLILARV